MTPPPVDKVCVMKTFVAAVLATSLLGLVGCTAHASGEPSYGRAPTPDPGHSYGSTNERSYGETVPSGGHDIDCADIGHPARVGDGDPNGLDADGDGIGCEDW
jgi:hypothetical protein